MTDLKLTQKGKAEQLINETLKGRKVHEIFTQYMVDQLLISGHPMPYWEKKFRIPIKTDDLTPAIAREMDMKIMELSQEATFLWNTAMARAQLIRHGNENVFVGKFTALVQEYKESGMRLPAQGTLENLARNDNLDVESAQAIADIEVRYWKSILDHLGRCQSILKNSSLMIATELKSMSNERLLDANERNMNGGNRQ